MMNRHRPSPRRLGAALVFLATSLVLLSGYAQQGTMNGVGAGSVRGVPDSAAGLYCGGRDLEHAPPPVDVDGLHAVPIDIQRVDARVVLDATARAASVVVAMHFRMGVSDGYPIFDLRQDIASATLNGAEVSPAKMAHHDFGGGADAEMRVLEVQLPACSDNVLALRYALEQPSAPESEPIEWDPRSTRVSWNFRLWDLLPGRFLESWFPANLIYDRFPFTLDLELRRSSFGHTLVTNGAVDELSRGHWRVAYPPAYTAFSQMLVLVPNDRVEPYSTTIRRARGAPIKLDLFREEGVDADLRSVANDVRRHVREFTASSGEYPYDRLTIYLWNDLVHAEEYDGATTTNLGSLKHEIFHNWYGRGVKPASQNDGWLDEAWNVYNTSRSGRAFRVAPLDPSAPPVTLSPSNPWSRITPMASYDQGADMFAGLAALMGLSPLREAMKAFYQQHMHELVTTEQIERHLYCTSMNAGVTFAFHRFVYGRTGAAPAPDPRGCW